MFKTFKVFELSARRVKKDCDTGSSTRIVHSMKSTKCKSNEGAPQKMRAKIMEFMDIVYCLCEHFTVIYSFGNGRFVVWWWKNHKIHYNNCIHNERVQQHFSLYVFMYTNIKIDNLLFVFFAYKLLCDAIRNSKECRFSDDYCLCDSVNNILTLYRNIRREVEGKKENRRLKL